MHAYAARRTCASAFAAGDTSAYFMQMKYRTNLIDTAAAIQLEHFIGTHACGSDNAARVRTHH